MLSVRLVPAGPQTELLAGAGLRGSSAHLQAGGRFSFSSVAPGTYTVKAIVGHGGGGRGAVPQMPPQWAAADIRMSGQDLVVPLMLQPSVADQRARHLRGRTPPTAAELQALSFGLRRALIRRHKRPDSGGGGRVDGDGRFTFGGVAPDIYHFVTTWNAPGGRDKWTIKSSTANGREAFEAPLRVNPNEPVEWTITFTDKPTSADRCFVGARRTRGRGVPYPGLLGGPQHWTPGSRRIRMTRPATNGAFSVKGLLPGDYFLAAARRISKPANGTIRRSSSSSSEHLARVTLRDGETTTQDFRIGG